jgi:hypothetical protein
LLQHRYAGLHGDQHTQWFGQLCPGQGMEAFARQEHGDESPQFFLSRAIEPKRQWAGGQCAPPSRVRE